MQGEALGIDIGGVIIDRANDGTATAIRGENYLQTSEVKHALECIQAIVRQRFGKRVYLVSKCGVSIQRKLREWLEARDFFAKTEISPLHLWFCKERSEKAEICDELGITHFVDDRLEVLGYLTNVEKKYLFRPRKHEVEQFRRYLPQVYPVKSWSEIMVDLVSESR